MKIIIIGIIGFLVVVYVFAYQRYKKNKMKNINTVQYFNETYLQHKKNFENENKIGSDIQPVDYVDRNVFAEEIQQQLRKKEPKKKLIFK